MSGTKAKLLCNFGGEFTRQIGQLSYIGGKTRLVLIDRNARYKWLRAKLSQLGGFSPSSIEIKFQLPNEPRLVSVECDDDVFAMISEFDPSHRIPVYIFDTTADSSLSENANPAVSHAVVDGPTSTHGENVVPIDPQYFADVEDDPISLPRYGSYWNKYLCSKMAESFQEYLRSSSQTFSVKEIIDELNGIPDFDYKKRLKAVNWLTKNGDQFNIIKNLPLDEKEHYILMFLPEID